MCLAAASCSARPPEKRGPPYPAATGPGTASARALLTGLIWCPLRSVTCCQEGRAAGLQGRGDVAGNNGLVATFFIPRACRREG